tara:strand:+ start:33 stop:1556 length:1524 start_codon:yes stop_codon:yes gene_type:complete
MEEEEQKIEEIQNTSFKGGQQIKDMLDDVWNTPSIFKTGKDMVTSFIDTRQQAIDMAAQAADTVVTGGLKKINMPGAEFIGDRARNITGFAADIATPEAWELPFYGAATAEPTPFGEGAVYGLGMSKRLMVAQAKAHAAFMEKAPQMLDWVFSSANNLFNKGNPNWRLATPDGGSINNVPNTMMKTTSSGSGGTKFIHSVYPKRTRGLYKQLDKQGLLDQAEKIVQDLDAFKSTEGKIQNYAKWNPDRPTTGFKGNRTIKYTDSAGNPSEVAFRWSVTKNTYVPYDLVKRQNTILKRMRWNVNRSPKAKWYSDRVYSIAKQDNATLKKLLQELRAEDPQRFFDIMGDTRHYATNKGFIFVEHIHAQNSPYWKYVKNQKFKPRDTSNLMIVKNEEFGKLKTAIEGEIYNNKNFKFPEGKRLLLDYDKKRDVLVLKQLQDNGRLKWVGDISPITNPSNWRRALDAALRGHKIELGKMGEIQQVIQAETDIPKHVDMIDKITDWKKNPYE